MRDGKADLAAGAWGYSSDTGRIYIFITEARVEDTLSQLQSIGALDIIGNLEVR
jgi:hypothetical protein